MRDETVFCVTNFRYHANPSSDRVFFRRRCNDSTFHLSRRPLAKTFGVAAREGGTNHGS